MPTWLSYPLVPALSSSLPLLALLSLLLPALSSCLVPALLSNSVLGLAPTCLIYSALRAFKQVLSNKPLSRQSTSLSHAEPLCLFPTLGLLPKKSDCKWLFDTAFKNSSPLVGNHAAKEVVLSFGECGCPASVKLNRLC